MNFGKGVLGLIVILSFLLSLSAAGRLRPERKICLNSGGIR